MLPLVLALLSAQAAPVSRAARDLPPGVPRDPAPTARPADPDREVARAMARLALGEPTVDAVQAAAARRSGFDAERAESWRARSRTAAWLPRLTAEYRHDDRSYRVSGLTGSGEVDYLREYPGGVALVRATWDLDALLFTPNEVRAAEVAARLLRARDERVERATRLFYKRQRLRLALLLDPPTAPHARAEAELEVGEVTAELDAATGGIFTGRAP